MHLPEPRALHLDRSVGRGIPCFRLRGVAPPDLPDPTAAVVWGREVLLIRDDYVLLREEFYDQDNKLVKAMETLNIEDHAPADIEPEAPLFGEGLGLDSIDVAHATAKRVPVLFTPGVPVSMKSWASKWERVGSGEPTAWTTAPADSDSVPAQATRSRTPA